MREGYEFHGRPPHFGRGSQTRPPPPECAAIPNTKRRGSLNASHRSLLTRVMLEVDKDRGLVGLAQGRQTRVRDLRQHRGDLHPPHLSGERARIVRLMASAAALDVEARRRTVG